MTRIEFEAEVKSFGFKPVRKNKSEGTLTLITESYNPGDEWRDLLNMNGQMIHVTIVISENPDSISGEARSR